jgi:hypothetical protein
MAKVKAMTKVEGGMHARSKDPGPEDLAFISPQLPARRAYSSERGVKFTLNSEWNDGMVEKWNIGYQKRMMVIF